MTKHEAYKKFDDAYEELEISPYNSAFHYFENGWDSAIDEVLKLIKTEGIHSGILKSISDLKEK